VIARVSDSQTFAFLVARTNGLQVSIDQLQAQIASGRRLLHPEDDPLGAGQADRVQSDLAALGQFGESTRFGLSVLGAQDQALGQADQIMTRAREIATQQASGLLGPDERTAAAEEVHGLLQGLTSLGNQELAGRRLFGGLALDAAAPFADPDAPGYSAATAYVGSTQELSVSLDGSTRVRVSTRGDAVFGDALTSLEALETALAPGGDVRGTLAGLAQGQATLASERASVGAREATLVDRQQQVSTLTVRNQETLSHVQDADLATVITKLTQAQTALQATLAAAAQLAQTSLVNLLKV
jgi:flagellar hook-associated protein 3 FlgL